MKKQRETYRFGLSSEEKKLWRRFQKSRINSFHREIEFLLTFEEWLKIWMDSGHLQDSGRGKEKFCMARYGDKGSYIVGNVRICTNRENQDELLANPEKLIEIGSGMRGKKHRISSRKKMSRSKLGNKNALGMKHSEETRQLIGNKSKENWADPKYAKHSSDLMIEIWRDPTFREKQSKSRVLSWKSPERREAAAERMRKFNAERREGKYVDDN